MAPSTYRSSRSAEIEAPRTQFSGEFFRELNLGAGKSVIPPNKLQFHEKTCKIPHPVVGRADPDLRTHRLDHRLGLGPKPLQHPRNGGVCFGPLFHPTKLGRRPRHHGGVGEQRWNARRQRCYFYRGWRGLEQPRNVLNPGCYGQCERGLHGNAHLRCPRRLQL